MMQVYLGWADSEGLRFIQPETDSTLRRFSQLTQHDPQRVAVWSVLDAATVLAIDSLLEAADYQTAWHFLQNHSAHLGRLI